MFAGRLVGQSKIDATKARLRSVKKLSPIAHSFTRLSRVPAEKELSRKKEQLEQSETASESFLRASITGQVTALDTNSATA